MVQIHQLKNRDYQKWIFFFKSQNGTLSTRNSLERLGFGSGGRASA
jgi:hypothetical protein